MGQILWTPVRQGRMWAASPGQNCTLNLGFGRKAAFPGQPLLIIRGLLGTKDGTNEKNKPRLSLSVPLAMVVRSCFFAILASSLARFLRSLSSSSCSRGRERVNGLRGSRETSTSLSFLLFGLPLLDLLAFVHIHDDHSVARTS